MLDSHISNLKQSDCGRPVADAAPRSGSASVKADKVAVVGQNEYIIYGRLDSGANCDNTELSLIGSLHVFGKLLKALFVTFEVALQGVILTTHDLLN